MPRTGRAYQSDVNDSPKPWQPSKMSERKGRYVVAKLLAQYGPRGKWVSYLRGDCLKRNAAADVVGQLDTMNVRKAS
jgi:hypothetical protein